MTNNEVYLQAIKTYGVDAQLLMVVEEMSELTKAICKENRSRGDEASHIKSIDNLIEETADVEIMLEQLKMIFCFNTESIKASKVARLKARLGVQDE